MSDLVITPYSFDRDDEILALLDKVFDPWGGDLEYFRWKYRDLDVPGCVFPRAWVIQIGGRIAAFNGYLPRQVRLSGTELWAAQSFDTATDPDYRGHGLFGLLQSQAYDRMREYGIRWVYGWTSEMGFDVFTRKLGWTIWGRQRYLVRVLEPGRFLQGKLPNKVMHSMASVALSAWETLRRPRGSASVEVRESRAFPEEVNALWERTEAPFSTIAGRTGAYLNWRLIVPGRDQRLLCAHTEGRLTGYVVFGREGAALEIYDCLVEDSRTLHALLWSLDGSAVAEGAETVRFRVNESHPWAKAFRSAGYFWSRTQFPMLGKRLDPEEGRGPVDLASTHWTVFDRNE